MKTAFPKRTGDTRYCTRSSLAAAHVGLQSLGLGVTRGDYLLHVPEAYQTTSPAPLTLWLHGAGGYGRDFLSPELQGLAEATDMLLLVPTSEEYTWDVIVGRGRYGPDVAAIDRPWRARSTVTRSILRV